jgi:hypothetical protein
MVAITVGLASEVMPVPGMLAAALVFPTGIHSDYAMIYLGLALCLNFALISGLCYLALRRWSRTDKPSTE